MDIEVGPAVDFIFVLYFRCAVEINLVNKVKALIKIVNGFKCYLLLVSTRQFQRTPHILLESPEPTINFCQRYPPQYL